jgi:hypothetical protein
VPPEDSMRTLIGGLVLRDGVGDLDWAYLKPRD